MHMSLCTWAICNFAWKIPVTKTNMWYTSHSKNFCLGDFIFTVTSSVHKCFNFLFQSFSVVCTYIRNPAYYYVTNILVYTHNSIMILFLFFIFSFGHWSCLWTQRMQKCNITCSLAFCAFCLSLYEAKLQNKKLC